MKCLFKSASVCQVEIYVHCTVILYTGTSTGLYPSVNQQLVPVDLGVVDLLVQPSLIVRLIIIHIIYRKMR